ncbi:MAG: hypothetical protein DHS20C17_31470 [Cyclobacteriaceae bacterium]|nr:MAG: hypothetical protein DHS20C17_31470 [Cyclobacteriaceae bacterium]
MNGNVEILTNNSSIQQAVLTNLGANFNNQMSVSINDGPASDIYNGNDPVSSSLACPLIQMIQTPNAIDDFTATDEGMTVNIDVLNNDDFGGDGPSTGAISINGTASNGTASVDDNGTPNDPTDDTVNYTPDPNYSGPDSFTYEICDSNGDCDQATVNVTVNPVNDLPMALDDNPATNEDTPINIDVLNNDSFGGDGPSMGTITITGTASNGTASVDDNGTPNDPTDDTINYIPDANYNGSDSFTYEICDANGDCDQATVNVTVNPVNDLPMAIDDNTATNEDMAVNIDVLNNDSFGGDGPSMGTITITGTASNGTASVDDNGTPNDPTDDTINYVPDANFNGNDSFAYQICDANGDCDQATVNVVVNSVNDLPVAIDDNPATNQNMAVNIDVLNNDDFGGDGPAVGAITINSPAGNGTASVDDNGTPNDPTDDTINYVPDTNFSGNDSFTYQICDANGDCDQATVNVVVNAVNDLPVAIDDNPATNEDMAVNIDVLNNDNFGSDGPSTGSISIVTGASNGTASIDDNGTPNDPTDDTINYTPDANFNGNDSFTYQICDANGDCDQATVNVTVNPVNDLPVAMDDNASTNENMAVNIDVLNNDDFGGDGPGMGAITITSPAGNGTASVDDNGTPNDPTDDTINYVPAANFNGNDSFTYQICDANGDCDQATVNLVINAVNNLPVAIDDNVNTNENTAINVDVLNNDGFGGDGPATGPIMMMSTPSNGTAMVNDNGTPNDPTDDTIDYMPDFNFTGNDSFIYQICDANGDCDQAVLNILIINQAGCPCMDPILVNCPPDVEYLGCMEDVPDPNPAALVANFACSGTTTATLLNVIETGDNCSGFAVTHVYEVTNGCQVEICEVTYSGQDFGFPTGVCPPDVTGLACVGDIPDPDPAGVAALFQDNCGIVTGQLIETIDDTDNCIYFSRTYIYEISDECGRSRICDVTYSGATQLPYITFIGADDLTCLNQVPPPDEEALAARYDSGCGDEVTAMYWGEITSDRHCSGFIKSYYYMVMLDCGSMIWATVQYTGTNCPGCENNGLLQEDNSGQVLDYNEVDEMIPDFSADFHEESPVEMNIYPNPTAESVNVLLTGMEDRTVELKVYTVFGAMVYKATVDFFKGQPIFLNLEKLGLSSGTYMIQVVSGKELLSQKVVFERR